MVTLPAWFAFVDSEVIAYDDLGTEAIRKLQVVDFPVIVVMDAEGEDLYERVLNSCQEETWELHWCCIDHFHGLPDIITVHRVSTQCFDNLFQKYEIARFLFCHKRKWPWAIVPCALIDSFKPFDERNIHPVKVKIIYMEPLYYEEYKGMKTVEIAEEVTLSRGASSASWVFLHDLNYTLIFDVTI